MRTGAGVDMLKGRLFGGWGLASVALACKKLGGSGLKYCTVPAVKRGEEVGVVGIETVQSSNNDVRAATPACHVHNISLISCKLPYDSVVGVHTHKAHQPRFSKSSFTGTNGTVNLPRQ